MAFQRYISSISLLFSLVPEETTLILRETVSFCWLFALWLTLLPSSNSWENSQHVSATNSNSAAQLTGDEGNVKSTRFVRCELYRRQQKWLELLHCTQASNQLPNQPHRHHLLSATVVQHNKKQSLAAMKMDRNWTKKTHHKSGWPFFPWRSRRLIFWQDLAMEISFWENYHLKL